MANVPSRIGRYEIKGRIGGGGMGTLYLARDTNPTTDRLVALKLLRASFDSDEIRQRFAREAQALAELNHPNIVIIHDSGEYEDAPFIVMEYVRGETLAESIRRRAPMSLGTKLRLLSELCAGLMHAHEAGIVHRDIKPANLMVDLRGRLKILDFGIARVVDPGMAGVEALTRLNVQIGTPGYMSPEQIDGAEIDGRSDLFSVGAVAYELISYHEAFPGASTRQIENKVLGEQPMPLVASIPGLDPEIAEIIGTALEKDVDRRCQHASTLGRAFDRVRARLEEEERLPRPTPLPKGADHRSRHERAAQVAYDRALTSYREGADGFARRSAMEALAESPQHGEARQLLGALGYLRDIEPWLPPSGEAPRSATPATGTLAGDSRRTTGAQSRVTGTPAVVASPAVAPQPAVAAESKAAASVVTTVPTEAPGSTKIWEGPPESPAGAPTELWREPASPASPLPVPADVAATEIAPAPPLPPPPERTPADLKPAGARGPEPPKQAKGAAAPRRKARKPVRVAILVVGLVAAGILGGLMAQRLWPARRPAEPVTSTKPERGTPITLPASAVEHLLTIDVPSGGTIDGAGIRCGSLGTDCSMKQPADARVTLTATPDNGFTFQAFTGDCSPAGETTMSAPRRCGATFVPAGQQQPWVLTIAKPAGGTIIAPGIKCGAAGSACIGRFAQGVSVTLRQQAEKGYVFAAFTGDCARSGKTVMNAARNCSATFVREAVPVAAAPVLSITRPVNGTIFGNGINCGTAGSECSAAQTTGASLTLRAQPDPGFRFVAFTGDCDQAGLVVMSASRSCSATFVAGPASPTAGLEMTTNLPRTRAFVVRTDENVTVRFVSDSEFGGYAGVLTRRGGGEFTGNVERAGCRSPSRMTLRPGPQGILVGQFELRSCDGRSASRIGISLTEKR